MVEKTAPLPSGVREYHSSSTSFHELREPSRYEIITFDWMALTCDGQWMAACTPSSFLLRSAAPNFMKGRALLVVPVSSGSMDKFLSHKIA